MCKWYGWPGNERESPNFRRFWAFLAVFHATRIGTSPRVIMMIFFANTALMYVLSRDIVDFFMTLGV